MTRRVLLTVVAVCALGVAAFFVPTALLLRSVYQHEDLLELQRLATVAARTAPADLGLAAGWRSPPDHPDHRYALYDRRGARIAGDGPELADPVVREALGGTIASRRLGPELIAAIPLGTGPDVTGVVRAAEPQAESTDRAAAGITRLAGLGLAAMAAAAAMGWLLLRRLLRPVGQLRAAADRLGAGDFTTAVPATGLPEFDSVGRALTASGRRIGQLLERERAFSAEVSHQLRTPLAAVMVALETELISPRTDRTAVLRESLEALGGLERTVTDLLALARDGGVGDPADVLGLLERACRGWAPAYHQAGRELRVAADDPVGPVRTSAAAAGQILDVLLENALLHGAGPVTVHADATPGGVAVTVADAGAAALDPDRLFRRRDPAAAGTGIGLALARTLAEADGARLRLAGTNPTRFELLMTTVPAAAAPELDVEQGSADR